MDKIIDFRQARQDRLVPDGSYFVRVDMYEDGVAGEVLGLGEMDADLYRTAANNLRAMSRYFRDLAHEKEGNDDDRTLAEVTIFSSGRILTFCDTEIETPAQFEWLDHQLDGAKESCRPNAADYDEFIHIAEVTEDQ